MGDAGSIKPNADASVNAVVLLREGKYGHAGIVIGLTEDEIIISETNYKPCELSTRTLNRTDPKIRGYRNFNTLSTTTNKE